MVIPDVDDGSAVCTIALGADVPRSAACILRPQFMLVAAPLVCTLHERTTWTETWSPLVAESACTWAPPVRKAIDIQPAIHSRRFMTVKVDAKSAAARNQDRERAG